MEGKKKNTGFLIIIILLLLIIIGLIGFIVKDRLISSEIKEVESQTERVKKLDETREWILDADYPTNDAVNKYAYKDTSQIYYLSDISLPYINIDSEYAKKSNDEIKELFDDALKKYNSGASGEMLGIENCYYRRFVNDSIASLYIEYSFWSTDVAYPSFYTYNIDLNTGKELSYEDIYTFVGFTSENIEDKVTEAIKKAMKVELAEVDENSYPEGESYETFVSKTIDDYVESVNNNTIKYAILPNGNLGVVVSLKIPAGMGEFNHIIEVEK